MISVLLLAFIVAPCVWQASRVPIRRLRQRQARVMCEALRGRERSQPLALIYARLLAFEELLLETFERRGYRVVRNRRYTGDAGVDGQVVIDGGAWLIQAKRYPGAIRPKDVRAFASLCAASGSPLLFNHTGHTDGGSHDVVTWHGKVDIVCGHQLLALVTDGAVMIGRRAV